MKIILNQRDEKELEVIINYHEMDSRVTQLLKRIESCDHTVYGNDEGRQFKISLYDIYYIESVDKKTFIYTKDQVFRSGRKLYSLMDELKTYEFVQVSKACILNLNVLKSIESLYNSRMIATLINGEKITVSRTYLSHIKAALFKEGLES